MENINSTNKGRDILLANKPPIVPWRTERMPQRIQRHSRVTLHRSTHPKWKQEQAEKSRPSKQQHYWKRTEYWEESWRLEKICCRSISSERPSVYADAKSSNNNNNNNDDNNKEVNNDNNKWYMHNPVPVLENDTHKVLWDFDIHRDHLISARRPDLIITNKKKREFAKLSTLLSRRTTE